MKEAANRGSPEKNGTMQWWIYALFLCIIAIVGHYLSLRWGGGQSGMRADLALGLAIMVVILGAVIVSRMWQ
jgi:hypothetical protein